MDMTQKEALYKIVVARDRRYDGKFYCGVHTTGIYCRPICPARPKLKNISFYRSSTEAETAGFRPCLRCRPELAPHSIQWQGTSAVVGRALSLIAKGEADEDSFEKLSNKLGVSDRHLRRLFEEHVGASPQQVAASKRLHLAHQLLKNSDLAITEIAYASGFQSIRQFNHAFKSKFESSPTFIRKRKNNKFQSDHFITVEIPIIAPFHWNHIIGFLESHGLSGVENFSEGHYRRHFLICGSESQNSISLNKISQNLGAIDVSFNEKESCLIVKLIVSDPTKIRRLIETIKDVFDTRLNPFALMNDLKTSDPITKCYQNELGIRIPGAWEPFETAICIILGQLVSVEQAHLKIKRLVEKFGQNIENPYFDDCKYLFPTPFVLAKADMKEIGLTKIRESAIQELSRLVAESIIDLSRSADLEKTRSQLLSIKGIGPWTVEMIAMRCLGDTNAFPKNDLIIKRALDHLKKRNGDWSPWNAYVSLALWKKYATKMSQKKPKTTSQK